MIRLNGHLTGIQDAIDGLRRIADRIPAATEQLASDAAETTKAALQESAPVSKARPGGSEPGALRKSIGFDLSGTTAEFSASDVAGYVIGGTPPHEIAGNSGPLHFYWDHAGGFVTFMRVQHPGTRPNDFREPALQRAATDSEELLAELGDELLGELA